MSIGLALGSGGARGLSAIGVLKVLDQNNIQISEVAASSMGAIVGAYYCAHGEIYSLEKKVLAMSKLEWLKLIDFNKPSISLIKGKKVEKLIRDTIGVERFSDLKKPLTIVATDLIGAKEVVFKRGNLIDAIMASTAIPGVFPPRKVGKMLLADGGIINPTPVHKLQTTSKIAVDLTIPNMKADKLDALNALSLAYSIIKRQEERLKEKLHKDKNVVVIEPRTGLELNGLLKFQEAKRFIRAGEVAAKIELKRLKKLK